MSLTVIIVESDAAALRAALLRDRRLEAIEIDWMKARSLVGAVMPATLVRTVSGMGTIVRLADGPELLLSPAKQRLPGAGERFSVQVLRDPDADKLGAATTAISLTGRGLVHLPRDTGIMVSKRLALDAPPKAALEEMLRALPGGWILRHSAGRLTSDAIAIEARALAAEGALLPANLAPPDAFRRLMVDWGWEAPMRILVSGRLAMGAVERWCASFAPDLARFVDYHDPDAGLFDSHDIDTVIDALNDPRVAFGLGASLIIERTAALTAIDVNAGSETNLLSVNLAAAAEIARQLRLRHVGGLIVIDFVSMPRPRDGAKVGDALRTALADDAAQTHILPISRFGLIEMTRDYRGPRLVFPT